MKRLIVIAALVLCGRASAQPDPKANAAAAYAEGEKLYGVGKYLDAAERFRSAFEQDPDPVYLFNIAQAYRLGEDCVKSSEYYKRFLAAIPNPPNAAKVRGWADEMETCAKTKLAPKPDSKLLQPAVPVTHPDEHVAPRQVDKPEGGGSGRTIAAISSAGVGVALVIVGVIYRNKVQDTQSAYQKTEDDFIQHPRDHGDTNHDANPCTSENTCDAAAFAAYKLKFLDPIDKTGHDQQRNAIIAFSLGGAAIVAGAVLLFTGHSSESPTPVSIATSNNGAMVLGSWSF